MSPKFSLQPFLCLLASFALWPLQAYGQTFSASATATGAITAHTIRGRIDPIPGDIGQPGVVFVVAVLPNSDTYFHGANGSWLSSPQSYFRGALAGADLGIVESPADLSALGGTRVYVGYTVCPSVQTVARCFDKMSSDGTVNLVYSIPQGGAGGATPSPTSTSTGSSAPQPSVSGAQKHSTLIFRSAASPVYFVTTAPSGTGIIAVRGAGGTISQLVVVKPDGTYYQLPQGTAGMSGMIIDGYEITVSSRDVNGNPGGISIKDPDGVVTSFDIRDTVPNGGFAGVVDDGCGTPQGEIAIEDPEFPRKFGCKVVAQSQHVTIGFLVAFADAAAQKAKKLKNAAASGLEKLTDLFKTKKISNADVTDELDYIGRQLDNPAAIDSNDYAVTVTTEVPKLSGSTAQMIGNLISDTKKLGSTPPDLSVTTVAASSLKTLDGKPVKPLICDAYQKAVNGVCVADCKSNQVLENGVCVTPKPAWPASIASIPRGSCKVSRRVDSCKPYVIDIMEECRRSLPANSLITVEGVVEDLNDFDSRGRDTYCAYFGNYIGYDGVSIEIAQRDAYNKAADDMISRTTVTHSRRPPGVVLMPSGGTTTTTPTPTTSLPDCPYSTGVPVITPCVNWNGTIRY